MTTWSLWPLMQVLLYVSRFIDVLPCVLIESIWRRASLERIMFQLNYLNDVWAEIEVVQPCYSTLPARCNYSTMSEMSFGCGILHLLVRFCRLLQTTCAVLLRLFKYRMRRGEKAHFYTTLTCCIFPVNVFKRINAVNLILLLLSRDDK